jgi:hypothetical protein
LLTAIGTLTAAAEDVSEQILAKAISDYKGDNSASVIGGINAALRGRLPATQVARAHYYRGLAYRKANQPGQAITDLTQALEYSGLSDTERSDAAENLQVAYQEAGIAGGEKVVVSDGAGTRARQSAPQLVAIGDTGATASAKAASGSGATTAAETATKWAPSTVSRSTAWSKQQVALAPLPPVVLPTRAPKHIPTNTPAGPASAFVTEVVAAQPVDSGPPIDASRAGVRLLVGETGSRNEAFALAIRLTSQHGAELGPRRPQIAEERLSDTSVYRLRLGPFADVGQAMQLCRSLRDGGNECVME